MSIRVMMAFVVNFLTLLFSATIARSEQNRVTFKISENAIYDCIDIYKQPGLDHPSLKNHTIQMKPSVSKNELGNQTHNNKTYNKRIECPDGTVPILKTSKEHNIQTQHFAEKYFHPLSIDSPGIHIVGVRSRDGPHGVEGWFNAHNLKIRKDQASYSHIYIGSGLNKEVNFIQAGFMINSKVFPDGVWTYGFWKGKDGKGCYNTACYGFVQVSKTFPIVSPMDLSDPKYAWLHYAINQDEQTGNWWLIALFEPKPENIGYWPKELFSLLDNGASMVGVGGVVQASSSGLSPPMGNGNFPSASGSHLASSLFSNIVVLDSKYKRRAINSFPIEKLVDSPQCYRLRIRKPLPFLRTHLGFFFNYGGPGGNSCGI